jgi:hypothetical protein
VQCSAVHCTAVHCHLDHLAVDDSRIFHRWSENARAWSIDGGAVQCSAVQISLVQWCECREGCVPKSRETGRDQPLVTPGSTAGRGDVATQDTKHKRVRALYMLHLIFPVCWSHPVKGTQAVHYVKHILLSGLLVEHIISCV